MPLTLTQVAVATAAVQLVTVQPGSSVTLLASAATNVGTSAAVTASSGFALAVNVPVTFSLLDYEGQAPVTLYGITATTATISVAISS